jgi:bifunctional DNase/RNase
LTLVDPRRVARVPIFIGESEGQIIQRRRLGLPFERPLTHDLLDDLVRRLGGRVAHVEIGELRGRTFIGTVVVHEGSTIHRVDARSSDAVAIALGHSAPVFVADAVIARAGL